MSEAAALADLRHHWGDAYEIGRVITIVEVIRPDGEIGIRVRAGQYPWVSMGMLDWAKKSLEAAISDTGE